MVVDCTNKVSENETLVASSFKRSKPKVVESLQALNKKAAIEKRANSLKYLIILNLIQFVNSNKKEDKTNSMVV